jgi:hypothetical protein
MEEDFEKPFLPSPQKLNERQQLNHHELRPYLQSNILWDQVCMLRQLRNAEHGYDQLNYALKGQLYKHETKISDLDLYKEMYNKNWISNSNELRSIERVRKKYGLPSQYFTHDLDAEWRKRCVLPKPSTWHTLNFDQKDLYQIRTQLQQFLSLYTKGESTDKQLLKKELDVELYQNPDYAKQLLQKVRSVNKQQSDEILQNEMDRLIVRGRKRQSDMAKSIRYISQYLLGEQDVRRVYEKIAKSSTSKTKKTKSKRPPMQPIPIDYDLRRRHWFNKKVMGIFDGKNRHLFDPFQIGIEPPLDASAYDPLVFEFSIFNPPKSSRRDAKPIRQPAGNRDFYVNQTQKNDWIPLIPQRRSRLFGGLYS